MNQHDKLVLLFDLYWLRFKKPGSKWYELTDYLRDKLIGDGISIQYTDNDLIFNGQSMLNLINTNNNEKQVTKSKGE